MREAGHLIPQARGAFIVFGGGCAPHGAADFGHEFFARTGEHTNDCAYMICIFGNVRVLGCDVFKTAISGTSFYLGIKTRPRVRLCACAVGEDAAKQFERITQWAATRKGPDAGTGGLVRLMGENNAGKYPFCDSYIKIIFIIAH